MADHPAGASAEQRLRWERTEYRPYLANRRAIEARLDAVLNVLLACDGAQLSLFDLDIIPPLPAADDPGRPPVRRAGRDWRDRLL